MSVPFPASGLFIESVRESARKARTDNKISVTNGSISRLLTSPAFTLSFAGVSKSHGLSMPLNFSSPLAELNVLAILSLLNFGSGYRVPLHEATGRGAWDSMRALVLSMYIADDGLLTARGMQSVDVGKVAELMCVNIHVEKAHESIPGVTVGELGGAMYELTTLITGVLNETGDVLVTAGYPDLGTFVAQCLEARDAQVILERLVRAIPAFRDMALVNGHPIYCFKKALFLINGIRVRFGAASSFPFPFPIPSTSHLPIFSDNVIPSLLIHLGVIDLSASPILQGVFLEAHSEQKIASLLKTSNVSSRHKSRGLLREGPKLTAEQSFVLRAAAIDACEMIVSAAESSSLGITLSDLDAWLWQIAKDRDDYRQLERFAEKETVFF
ncbi:uncharacterized protein BT62DRAFT_894860 [Guyanagaster necrorhizus]|uniref:Queuosine 5'-phosphate N-glycosylase/hydrolase n=1 Tax=Guyanagaster necrorhizus TaxID=856835 RepID=A0A9P8ASI8_9AGAR|nr:uncharacterized protein BT62DRAFT_894860 [Guyanagaster necrorhizus MCA 3950]KAG7446448.1 hypothetical protein BT62DRAFT_894860 [Guyanagaster necrorhizus MCA 3950]